MFIFSRIRITMTAATSLLPCTYPGRGWQGETRVHTGKDLSPSELVSTLGYRLGCGARVVGADADPESWRSFGVRIMVQRCGWCAYDVMPE